MQNKLIYVGKILFHQETWLGNFWNVAPYTKLAFVKPMRPYRMKVHCT